jgi:hypothetical protein
LSVADSAVNAWLFSAVGSAAIIWPFSAAEAALNGLARSPASRARRKAHQRQWSAISEHTTLN